jgi:hypothetical protein
MQNRIEQQELEEDLNQILQEYRVPYPDENRIDHTVETLRQYVPSRKSSIQFHFESLKRLMKNAVISMNFMGVSYWVITFLVYAVGYIVTVYAYCNPYKLVLFLSPFPVLLGMIEAFRGREENVTELELACKITPQEILISKILVICVYNIVLNMILSLLLYSWQPFVALWRITMLWLVPMVLAGGFALWFCSKFKGRQAILLSVSCWVLASLILTEQAQTFAKILTLSMWYFIAILCIGVALFAAQLFKLKDRYYFERSAHNWN